MFSIPINKSNDSIEKNKIARFGRVMLKSLYMFRPVEQARPDATTLTQETQNGVKCLSLRKSCFVYCAWLPVVHFSFLSLSYPTVIIPFSIYCYFFFDLKPFSPFIFRTLLPMMLQTSIGDSLSYGSSDCLLQFSN